ncbi:MAG: DsrE family protein [Actinomycetaceae bacterium]|nr:DsrE family protein [Actinomycetaceae bacterium]
MDIFGTGQTSKTAEPLKLGIIIETKEFEKAWNALRFANTALGKGHEVKVFLMGEAVEIPELTHEKWDPSEQLDKFAEAGGEVMACGTCLKSRKMEGTEVCSFSTMLDCLALVEWSDKVLTF